MRKMQRVRSFLLGILTLVAAAIMVLLPEQGYYIIIIFMCASMIITGVKYIVQYFTLARHMVGGKRILLLGLIVLILGIFTITLFNIPQVYIMIYLLGVHAFYGAVNIMRAMEEKSMDSSAWKIKLIVGIGNFMLAILALLSIIFFRRPEISVYIYSVGLVYSGVERIVASFRKTAVVFISN